MTLVSILIPIYNEEKYIEGVLNRVLALPLTKEVICINDGSKDKTVEILSRYIHHPNVRVMHKQKNMGKGAAVIDGIKAAQGDIIIIQDSDSEYDPAYIPELIRPIEKGMAKVVYGSRFLGKIEKMGIIYVLGNKFLTFTTNALFGSKITDMETGFKAFKAEIIKDMELNARGFELEPIITAWLIKKGQTIREIPIQYVAREKKEKKIGIWDGCIAVYYLFKSRFLD